MRALARHAGIRVFRFFARSLGEGEMPQGGQELRRLALADVLAHCGEAELDLREEAVKAAYARGDLCIAASDSGRLAGYCWLAFSPLPHLDGVSVDFGGEVAWLYKSLVLPEYRGRALAARLYRYADTAARERGRTSSVICVEAHNRPSITAALRAGYADTGRAAYLRRGPVFVQWRSAKVRRWRVAFFIA